MNKNEETTIAVVGLGYVGLPLAIAFGKTSTPTIGFDVNKKRIEELKNNLDSSGESSPEDIGQSKINFTDDPKELRKANFIIVAVPTPVTKTNHPDLTALQNASAVVGKNLAPGSVIVYESTVYPGATEEECIPVLEKESKLTWKKDFFVGYSPERINPGDKEHSLQKVIKVVSGDSEQTTNKIATVYKMVCSSGIYVAENIKTAEAAKVIENTQRDLNIALMNELALICHRIGINTDEVIKAASTKWNFLPFTPGLVGGHCIGVDPYYLVYKAEQVGYHPEVITAGRRLNDFMSEYVADETIKGIADTGKEIKNSKILIMGLTFKENVADYRNSRIAHTAERLREFGAEVFGFDPYLDEKIITEEFRIKPINQLVDKFDAIIISAPHSKFKEMKTHIIKACNGRTIIFDLKGIFPELKKEDNLIYKTL